MVGAMLLTLGLAANCARVMPPPTPSQLAGNWRVVVPSHWRETRMPSRTDLQLKNDGTYLESERWGAGVETTVGRWSVIRGENGPQVQFVGTQRYVSVVHSAALQARAGLDHGN